MNFSRLVSVSPWRRLVLALIFGSCLGLLSRAQEPAANPEVSQAALAAAKTWLAEIDAGKYQESYTQGCTAFHNKVSEQQWITVLTALRPSIGNLVSRKEVKLTYKPDGYEGLEGECMVIMYNATFSKLGTALEAVVLKREDGQWRGAGYNAQPQQQQTTTDQ
jgi:hypothetical protein